MKHRTIEIDVLHGAKFRISGKAADGFLDALFMLATPLNEQATREAAAHRSRMELESFAPKEVEQDRLPGTGQPSAEVSAESQAAADREADREAVTDEANPTTTPPGNPTVQ